MRQKNSNQNNSKKKNLLIFLPEFPVLTETFIEREIQAFVTRGRLNVTVLSLSKGKGTTSKDVDEKVLYKTPSMRDMVLGFLFYFFTKPLRVVKSFFRIWGHDQTPFIIPRKKAFEHHYTFSQRLAISRFIIFLKAFGYSFMIKDLKPDHMLVHFASSSSTLIMCVSALIDVSYSISAHARDILVDGQMLEKKAKTAKNIFICNKFAYDFWRSKAGNGNLHLHYHGVDFKSLTSHVGSLNKTNKKVILNVSRLVEKKGHMYLIEAANILRSKFNDFIVYIIGPSEKHTDFYDQIKKQISKNNLTDNVKIVGNGEGIPFKQVIDYYKIADVFAFPAIITENNDSDGIPNGIIEASILGVPVVATDAGSITEVIKDRKSGLIVKQKDPEALASALFEMLQDQEAARKYVNNAQNIVESMFEIDKNVGFIEEKMISS